MTPTMTLTLRLAKKTNLNTNPDSKPTLTLLGGYSMREPNPNDEP